MAVQNNHNGLIRARKPSLVMTSFFLLGWGTCTKDKHIQQHKNTQNKNYGKFKV